MIKINVLKNKNQKASSQNASLPVSNEKKNKGGLLGGLGYVGGSIAAGVGGIGEGIIDLLSAGGALLTGDVDYAKYVFKDNVVGNWHEDLTEEFNPGTGWKFAGDVASGIGQSATLFIPYAGAPLFFAGVMSQGISGAAEKTGDVGLKEVAYGVTSGAIEGTLEMALGAAGKGAKSIASSAMKSLGKNSVKGLAKSAVRRGVAGKLLSGAAGEFVEEAISEAIDPMIQRLYQIDPNASTSMKDVLYAGLVGAVAGAVTTGAVEIPKSASNRARGARVIKNGNSQTLVNRATILADRLAGAGTDFKNAPEWVRTLRGEIDAYNELAKKGKQNSASAETILGEMQASVGFAEMQAINAGITAKIKGASEADRAALAEYINMTVDAKNRPKTYTAEDIAKDTDGVATQLAIMEFAGSAFDIDGAMDVSGDVAQESAIASVIAEESGEAPRAESRVPSEAQSETDPAFEQAVRAVNEGEIKHSLSKTKTERLSGVISDLGKKRISKQAGNKKIIIQTDDYTVNKNIFSDKGRKKSEVNARIKNIDNFEQLLNQSQYAGSDTEIHGVDNDAKKGVVAIHKFKTSIDGYNIEFLVRDKGKNQYLYEAKFIENKKSSQQSMTDKTASPAPDGDAENNKSIPQTEPVVNPSGEKKYSVATAKKAKAKIKENAAKTAQKSKPSPSPDGATTFQRNPSPSPDGATSPEGRGNESITDEQKAERAKARAEAWIEWEKNTRPTAKELNTVREYVKGFDNLSNPRRLAIIRMIRSAKGVDAKIVKGLANLMVIKAGADLDIRFDEKISNEGVTVPMGDKTLILIGTSTDFKKTIKGTIAHELVHYLEKKPGYKAFAENVMKHVKPEVRARVEAEVTENYNEFYTDRYTEEFKKQGLSGKALDKAVKDKLASAEHKALIDSEVVANLVGRALDNEKFLSRYARIGNNDGFIKRAYSFLRGMVKELRSKGEESEEARELADIIMPTIKSMDRLLQQGNAKEGVSGEKKYIFAGEKSEIADKMKLARAKEMLESGADSETVRKETGWFKGYDGKWRFEIVDLQMDVSTAGKYTRDPEIKRYLDLMNKAYFEMTATKEELSELKKLDTSIGDRSIAPGTLGDLIYHPALFESYPELENVKIRFEDGLNDTRGVFNPDFNEIVLSKSLKTNPKQLKKTLIHEMQHAVQHIEEFAKGSSPEYWTRIRKEAIETVAGARENLDLWLEDIGYPQFAKESMARVVAKEITLAEHWEVLEDFKKNSKYAKQIANSEKEVAEYERRLSELNSLGNGTWATPKEMYFATAGEVEARDAAERSGLTEEQRKNTRPDVDREDVVFAEGSVNYYAANDKSAENESTKEQLRNHLDEVNDMEPVANVKYHVINKEKAKQDAKDFYKSKGYKIDRQNFGIIEMGESEVELSSNYANTAAEFAAWMTIPNVLKRGRLISGHNDHKGEGFPTYTFAAPVVINGEKGVVAVVVRKTGKYRYKMHRILMPDGSIFVYKDINENAELTGSDVLLKKKEKGPDISSASTNSIPQKSDLSTVSEKKYSIAKKNGGKKNPKEAARKNATVASEYAGRYAGSFMLNSAARKKVEEELEAIESDFVKGGEGYTEKFQKRVRRIWETIKTDGSFKLISEDEKFGEFSRYMFRKKFRVDKRFREEMGAEWKDIYKALRGRIAADTNTKYSHIDTFYAELSEQFPDMFPEDIVNIHDQLDRIAKIIGESKNSTTSEFTYDQLPDEMQATVNVDVIDMINSFVTKIESNRDVVNRLKKENEALIKSTLSMRNKIARERAENAKAENAQVFAKKDVKIAVDSIEGWTQEEVLSLAKGQELKGMSRAKREEMISQIYIALHEEGAKGRVGPGSVAVKTFAAEIANDYLDSAQIKGADGKSVHLSEIYDELSINRFKQELTDLLYGEFANMGQTTQNAEFQAIIRAQKESFLRDQLNDKLIGKETRNLAYQGKKLRELVENQKRDGAAEDISKVTKKLAAVVDAKGNIRVNAVDEAMKEASRFFDAEKKKAESAKNMLKTSDGKETQALSDFAWEQNEELKFMIDEYVRLRRGREGRALSTEELKLAAEVLRGMKTTLERYNKEFINGHWVDVDEAAKACVADLTAAWRDKEYKNKAAEILGGTVDWIQEKYFYKILTPETVVETLEGYAKSGILKQLYHSIRVHKQRAEHLAVQMKKPLFEFIESKENDYTDDKGKKRSFRTKLNAKKISIDGADITLGEAIYLYMLTKREEAHAGLLENGYIVFDDKNQRRAAIAIPDIETVRSNIYNQLDKTDIEFLKLSEDFFNKTASKIKYDADMKIFGYTNIRDGYYVPMIRDRYSRMNGVTDARQSIGSIITVYNKSFNQNLVENARALEGKNIMSIINDHADGLADYAELYLPLKAFDRTYNRAVGTSDGSIRSIREVLNKDVWNGTERYFKDLFADIQGQREQRDDVVNNLVGKIRSGWVNSVLGANLKVVATQTTSLVSATQVIGAKYIAKCSYLASPGKIPGLAEIRARAYEYSDIIEARSFDMGALKSQGNVDKINAIGEKTGWAIGWMDERICLAVFHAAELQIQDQQGYAVGTPENAERAARLADEAIYTTQAMSSASERSALQRSTSEIGKMLAMFTSDTVKNLSHLYGNINKWNAYKARVKSGDVSYEAEMKKAGKDIRRSVRTLACTGIMLGLIAQGFKYLYGREEEEPEDKQRDFIYDIAGSTLNILPIVSDIADKLFFDYDMSLNVLDVANDTLEAVSGTFKMAGNVMKGEYVSRKQITKNSINVAKSVGSFFGLPITPVERTVSGLLRFVSPEAAYSYNSNFGAKSYTSDLQAAVESGDERLAEHVLEQLYRNEVAGVYTSAELEEIVRLYGLTDDGGKHYNVLPQKIGTEINGVVLNKAQRKQFEKVYSQASAEVNKLIRSEYYQELNDEQRAKAIKNLYALYYNRAASEVTGAEWTRAQAYSLLTDNYSALFAAQAYRSGLEATKDASGKEVTVKAQFVDYMKKLGLSESDYVVIAYANSVRDKQTRAALLAHINSLALSDEQKAKLAEALGLEVKNGKVVEKEE